MEKARVKEALTCQCCEEVCDYFFSFSLPLSCNKILKTNNFTETGGGGE